MARPLRIDTPNVLYHMTSRGLVRRAIAHGDRGRERCLEPHDRDRRLPARVRR